MEIIFIADFFADQVLGGGELNNEELINILSGLGHRVKKLNSHTVTPEFIEQHRTHCFIVANFINLSLQSRQRLHDKKYIIYEHDHKYLTTRDPGHFKDFKAPPEAVINQEFYQKAQAVLCQSQFHLEIIQKNLQLDNLVNLSGNLWSTETLDFIKERSYDEKKNTWAVMNSTIEHKNTRDAVRYCEYKKMPFNLIGSNNYKDFLRQMSENNTFVFFPKTPETLSRVIVEARMMGLSIITNKSVGATREEWYKLKGPELVEKVCEMRTTIPSAVMEAFKE